MQAHADDLPLANRYCTDELAVYEELLWPSNPQGGNSRYVISHGKEQTYTIESMNADLRTYLGRLKRRSRCFSRCIHALKRAVRLFVWYSTSVSAATLLILASKLICVSLINHSQRS